MFPYEHLDVYKKAFRQNQKVYQFLKEGSVIPRYMRDQFGRASLSIQLNIAEGTGRPSKRDKRYFYVIARSSALECGSITDFLRAESEISIELAAELRNGFEELSMMLYAMIKKLS